MALLSPGVEVNIITEGQYASSTVNTVPYILIATAENKVNAAGTAIAAGTIQSDTNDLYLITSQRELVNTFGNPYFYKTTGGVPLNGYELNEYGLMTAYSVLGITNRVYVHRADVDLAELSASLVRPLGNPNSGEYWLDLTESEFGIFTWNASTNRFTNVEPIIISAATDIETGTVPKTTVGNIGDYAVVTYSVNNPVYLKNSSNAWVLIGSDDWKSSIPCVTGTESSPTLSEGAGIVITGPLGSDTVDVPASPLNTVAGLAAAINTAAIAGVTAAAVDNKLAFYVASGGDSEDSSEDVSLELANETSDDVLTQLGIDEGTYYGPLVDHAAHTSIPRWRSTDSVPRPSDSIWIKTTSVNDGMNIVVKRYDSVTDTFIIQSCSAYAGDVEANYGTDPGAGGENIATGATYAQYDINENDTGTLKIFTRTAGDTVVTSEDDVSAATFTVDNTFDVYVSSAGSSSLSSAYEVTLTGTTINDFISDWSAANIPNTTVELISSKYLRITHTAGGVIVLEDTLGTPVATAGIDTALDHVRANNAGQLILSNWDALEYTQSLSEPGQDPADGKRWYYSAIDEADIMIQDGGTWQGYQNVDNDVRGFDLSDTNPYGPIFAASAPEYQDDDSNLVHGDLWIDTSDLENYPVISRWEEVDGQDQWVLLDNSDQTTMNGVLFADARWSIADDGTDVVTDDIPTIVDLLTSDYLDADAPLPSLYPEGTLLFNTRRSGYNVKEFRSDYFNIYDFDLSVPPTETDAWVTVSGLRNDGSPNMGRHAQRALVVAAMKSAIDTSEEAREEQRVFNLVASPGYPELVPNMVALNNERKNTAFIVGDTPLRLANVGADLIDWATNNNGLGLDTGDGLLANDEYLGAFYPSGQTNDLSGSSIVVPASHMMLRTIVRSDSISYPWMAPAGTRRGQIDNASALGYVDATTGEFRQIQVREGIRNILYPYNVNPLTYVVGAGYINDGNKTTQATGTLDRINVARLAAFLHYTLYVAGRPFVHEPNDKITRDEFKGVLERIMNDLIAKRAIYDYFVVCDKSNNTNARIAANEIWADVGVEAVEAGEMIYIPLRFMNPGDISGNQND